VTNFEITRFKKEGGPLTKRLSLSDGGLRADASQCRMSTGTATRVRCVDIAELARVIDACGPDEAIAIGRMKDGVAGEAKIACKDKLAKHPGAISRSLDHFEFADGPGPCLLDIDLKGAPADLDPIAALTQVLPDLDFIAHVERASTSSGVSKGSTGESYPGSTGRHIYILVKNQRDVPRFLKALRDRLWLISAGWGTVSAVGSFLDRSVVDVAVGSPERLAFEGGPIVAKPLVQAPRPAKVINPTGKALDTKAACPNLSKEEAATVAKLKKAEELRLLPERKRKRDEWSAPRIEALVKSGVDEKEARTRVARAIDDCRLYGEFVLQFDGELGDVSVSEVLSDPEKYVGKTLSDPHEGPSCGTGKARLYRHASNGSFIINSFAHGKRKYELLSSQGRFGAVEIEDFWFLMTMADACIFAPTGAIWPGSNVNKRLPKVTAGEDEDGKPLKVSPTAWLAKHRAVEQTTWAPGLPKIIKDRLFTEGGFMAHEGARAFNLYSPPEPTPVLGDATKAALWVEHVQKIYPEDFDHIFDCLAHRVQKPDEKINHAIVLGGPEGVGKDSLLEPAKRAVGPWNFRDVDPATVMGRFGGWKSCVILRVSEARDQGEYDRFKFADHMKTIIAAPPDVLRVDEKNKPEYYVQNCCFVIYTTNHRTDALYVTINDRRHYFMWSPLKKEDFEEQYWKDLWHFYEEENGYAHVRAFLEKRDISAFNPKAPPKRNDAFYAALTASAPAEESEMADVIDAMGNPHAFTIQMALSKATALAAKDINGKPDASSFAFWLGDRKNRRKMPHRMEDCGYSPFQNKDVTTGMWTVDGKRQMIYVKSNLSKEERQKAAAALEDPPPRQNAEQDDNVVPMRPPAPKPQPEPPAPASAWRSTWNTNDLDEIDF
jgi:Family of unknown function (DUF5906)